MCCFVLVLCSRGNQCSHVYWRGELCECVCMEWLFSRLAHRIKTRRIARQARPWEHTVMLFPFLRRNGAEGTFHKNMDFPWHFSIT